MNISFVLKRFELSQYTGGLKVTDRKFISAVAALKLGQT